MYNVNIDLSRCRHPLAVLSLVTHCCIAAHAHLKAIVLFSSLSWYKLIGAYVYIYNMYKAFYIDSVILLFPTILLLVRDFHGHFFKHRLYVRSAVHACKSS